MDDLSKGVMGGAAGLVAHFAGLDWELVMIWLLLMALDIITGFLKARRLGINQSNKMRTGLFKKLYDACAVVGLLLMQEVVNYMGINIPIGPVLLGAFCFKEVTSILENTTDEKTSLPAVVQEWLNAIGHAINGIHEKESEDDNEST